MPPLAASPLDTLNNPVRTHSTQVSCTYGPSLHPNMVIALNIDTSLLNISYTVGYTPPPSRLANPYNFLASLPTTLWAYNTLRGNLTFSIYNNDTSQGHFFSVSGMCLSACSLQLIVALLPE